MEQLFYDALYAFPMIVGMSVILTTVGIICLIIYMIIGALSIPNYLSLRQQNKAKRPQ